MCCGHTKQHAQRHGASCCCGQSTHFGPQFWSKKKKLKALAQALENLREEAQEVEELIAELKQEK